MNTTKEKTVKDYEKEHHEAAIKAMAKEADSLRKVRQFLIEAGHNAAVRRRIYAGLLGIERKDGR